LGVEAAEVVEEGAVDHHLLALLVNLHHHHLKDSEEALHPLVE
jgi:hypothetical protein